MLPKVDLDVMYPAQVNSPSTALKDSISASQDSIEVLDASRLPQAPNLVVLGDGEDAETILYTTKTGNVLGGITRGFQGAAKTWIASTPITRFFCAYDHNTFKKNIEEVTETVNAIADGVTWGDLVNKS